MTLKITQSHLEELRRHGEETYPEECCDVLVGDRFAGCRTVVEVIRCANASQYSRQNHYQIAPDELVRIQSQTRLVGHEIVGFHHSHPDQPARWSSTDIKGAFWTGCSYLITSVGQGRANETASFELHCTKELQRFENEDIEVLVSYD